MSNVIVFMSDEHNPRYSSPYGHGFVDTPNMQWLADNGTLFEHATARRRSAYRAAPRF